MPVCFCMKLRVGCFMHTHLVTVILYLVFVWADMAFGSEPVRLTVGGTGSGMGVLRVLGESYSAQHPDVIIKVLPSLGTGGGIRALKAGVLDLAIASRQLEEPEKIATEAYFLGKSPFIFAVHPKTPIENVSLAQIVHMYDGTISTWPDGSRVRRILRPACDSDWQLMHTLSPEMAKALEVAQRSDGLHLAVTDIDAIKYIERVRGAFGSTTLTMVLSGEHKVKVLSYNGIHPATAVRDRAGYPLMKSYYLLTRGDVSLPVADFLDYIFSAQGRHILSRIGIMMDSNEE